MGGEARVNDTCKKSEDKKRNKMVLQIAVTKLFDFNHINCCYFIKR